MNDTINILVYLAGALVTITAAVAIIVKALKNQVSRVAMEANEASSKELMAEVQKISIVLAQFQENYNCEQKKYSKVLMTLAQDRICQVHDYFLSLGKIDTHNMFIVEQLYDSYKTMGGNGHAESQMRNLRKLLAESLHGTSGGTKP